MDEKITHEKENNAIDLTIAMTIDEIAEEEQCSPFKILPEFLASRTAQMLYDPETKLWWEGPSSIAERYFNEIMN